MRRFPTLPARIERLEELAYNLKWSWDYRARLLFKRLDPELWKTNEHNPVKLLNDISPQRLIRAAEDPDFLRDYEVTLKQFDRTNRNTDKWFPRKFPELKDQQIAYILTYVRQEWGNNAGPISAPGVQMPPSPATSRTRQIAASAIILLVDP